MAENVRKPCWHFDRAEQTEKSLVVFFAKKDALKIESAFFISLC